MDISIQEPCISIQNGTRPSPRPTIPLAGAPTSIWKASTRSSPGAAVWRCLTHRCSTSRRLQTIGSCCSSWGCATNSDVLERTMTLHYDGVPGHENEPVVVAVFDIDPVELQLSDPGKPAWRRADSVVSTAAAKLGE